jgi:hypothetical protein
MSIFLGSVKSDKDVQKELKRLIMLHLIADNKIVYNDNGRVEIGYKKQYGASKRLSAKAFQFAKKNNVNDIEYINIYSDTLKEFTKLNPDYYDV